ncbi:MAG: PqiC family protein [Candidatus Binatia bacterium]
MRRFNNLWTAVGFAGLALSGCAALEPKADPSRFFTLTPVSQFDQNRPHDSPGRGGISIGIGPVKLPGYLDREQLVIRVSQNRFQVAENDRWAEPLEENFTRVLLQNLTALVPTARFVSYPWRPSERPDYQLEINVLRFEPNAAAHVELIARWFVREAATKQASAVKETRLTPSVKGSSTEAAVAALSGALGEFSREIAQALQALEAKAKP